MTESTEISWERTPVEKNFTSIQDLTVWWKCAELLGEIKPNVMSRLKTREQRDQVRRRSWPTNWFPALRNWERKHLQAMTDRGSHTGTEGNYNRYYQFPSRYDDRKWCWRYLLCQTLGLDVGEMLPCIKDSEVLFFLFFFFIFNIHDHSKWTFKIKTHKS